MCSYVNRGIDEGKEMDTVSLKSVGLRLALVMFAGFMPLWSSCTTAGAQALDGIIQNIDTANGKITIVTKDGATHVVTIQSGTQVETNGSASTADTLEIGSMVEVEMEDDRPKVINALLNKVEGTVSDFSNGQLTVGSGASSVKTEVTAGTRFEGGNPADLRPGAEVEVKYDPSSLVALKVDFQSTEESSQSPDSARFEDDDRDESESTGSKAEPSSTPGTRRD